MFARLKDTGQHTTIFGIGSLLQQGANFLLLPVYTRYLSPAEYGVINLLLVGGMLLSSIVAAPVGAALFRSYYDYDSKKEQSVVVSTALFLVAFGSSILLVVGALFSSSLSVLLTGDAQYAFLCVLVLITSTFNGISMVTLVVFRAQKWSVKYVAVSLGTLFVSMFVTIYLVVFRQIQIAGVIIGGMVGSFVSLSASLWLIRHHIQLSVSIREIRKMLHFGLPLVPENLGGVAFNSIDRLAIQAFLGPAAVGVYALGRRLGQVVQILIIQPYSLAEAPAVLSAEHDPIAKKFYARLLTYYLLATIIVSLGVILLTPDFLKIMADKEYWGAAIVVPWICGASILYGMRNLVGIGLGLKRKTIWFPVALGAGAIVYTIVLIFMIPKIGILGAGIALAVAYGIICIVRFFAGQRIYPMRFETMRILKLLIATFIVLFIGETIDIENVWLSIIFNVTLVIIGLPLLLFGLRFADENEIAYLKGFWVRFRRGFAFKSAIH